MQSAPAADLYRQPLEEYLRTRSEAALYRASLLSVEFIERGLGPDDIISLHFEALDEALAGYTFREHGRVVGDAHQFLLEVMIAFGVKYKEHLEYRLTEGARQAEARMAAERQRALEAERAAREKAEILERISDAFYAVDNEWRITYLNRRAQQEMARMSGIAAEQLVGMELWEVLPKTAHSAFYREYRRAAETQAHIEFEAFYPPLGAWFQVHLYPSAEGLSVYHRDVTNARRLSVLEERERIAMDLHDGVIQSLYAVGLGLAAQEHTLDGDTERTRRALLDAVARINGAIEDIRAYILGLRSDSPEPRSLRAGLQALAEELRQHGVQPELVLAVDADDILAPETAENLLYILREAASNVIRHARASVVSISLAREGDSLCLTIRDDGRGFDPTRPGRRDGHGMRNMAERARAIGGSLAVVSQPERGTEVRLEVPVEEFAWPRHR